MKHIDPIDELFKTGLQDEGMPYEEAYWNRVSSELDSLQNTKGLIREFYLFSVVLIVFIGLNINAMTSNNSLTLSNDVMLAENIADKQIQTKADETTELDNRLLVESKIGDMPLADVSGVAIESPKSFNQTQTNAGSSAIAQKGRRIEENKSIEFTEPAQNQTVDDEFLQDNDGSELAAEQDANQVQANQNLVKLENGYVGKYPMKTDALGALRQVQSEFIKGIYDPVASTSQYIPRFFAWYTSASVMHNVYTRQLQSGLTDRKSEELTKSSLGMGLNVRVEHGNWSLRSGVNYLSLKEVTNYTTRNRSASYDTSYALLQKGFSQSSQGRPVSLIAANIDSAITTTSQIDCPDCQVRFNYLKMPLVLEYRFQLPKFNLGFYGGTATSLLVGANGKYMHKEQLVNLSQDRSMLNTMLWSAEMGTMATYKIRSDIGLQLQYGFSKSLTSMVRDYQQVNSVHSLRLGVEYRW